MAASDRGVLASKLGSSLAAFARESDEEYRVKGRALAAYALDREEEYEASLAELIERWGDQYVGANAARRYRRR